MGSVANEVDSDVNVSRCSRSCSKFPEKNIGRSKAIGSSAVSWSSGLIHGVFDGSGALDGFGWRIGHFDGSR